MKLTNFIGNEKVIDRLSKLMESGRFPHALIIEGEEGIGKKTLAKDIACALVCRGNDKPCGECAQCNKALTISTSFSVIGNFSIFPLSFFSYLHLLSPKKTVSGIREPQMLFIRT